jgi:penicillin-binding protein 1C
VRVDLGIKAGDSMPLALKVRNGSPPFTWFADGTPIGTTDFGSSLSWAPRGPGFVDLMVIDSRGAAATSSVYLE